jgi:hypothetical protein
MIKEMEVHMNLIIIFVNVDFIINFLNCGMYSNS